MQNAECRRQNKEHEMRRRNAIVGTSRIVGSDCYWGGDGLPVLQRRFADVFAGDSRRRRGGDRGVGGAAAKSIGQRRRICARAERAAGEIEIQRFGSGQRSRHAEGHQRDRGELFGRFGGGHAVSGHRHGLQIDRLVDARGAVEGWAAIHSRDHEAARHWRRSAGVFPKALGG